MLAELMLTIVCIGCILAPMLVFVSRVPELNAAIGQQGRREAWRSFNDQALAAGIDPSRASGLASAHNLAVPGILAPAVSRAQVTAVAGRATIVPLQMPVGPDVGETRPGGAGYELGAGGVVPGRSDPLPPLPPIVMPLPVLTPANGTVVQPADLTAGGAGQPFTLPIQARTSGGVLVQLAFDQPVFAQTGIDLAVQTVNAVDLTNGVRGRTWGEYVGSVGAGDRAVALTDGRTRWLVMTASGRLQIYEPSAVLNFAYKFGLGAPVLVENGTEQATGSALNYDYTAYLAVQSKTATLRLDMPAATKAVFGNQWAAQGIGFNWTWGSTPGAFAGDLADFFTAVTLPLWGDTVTVNATPVAPSGAEVAAGSWTINRVKTALKPPEMLSAADGQGFYTPWQIQFAAPQRPEGRVGRLSFENGTILSTGTTIQIPEVP